MPPPQPTSSTCAPGKRRDAVDPVQAQRIDFVQGPEFAFEIPPAVGEFGEFGEFRRIGIHGICHAAIMKRRELKWPAHGRP